jgi:chromosome segregation ATPase
LEEMNREVARTRRRFSDINLQNKHLLKEIAVLKGDLVEESVFEKSSSSPVALDIETIISNKLVTYSSVEDLLEQNAQLRDLLRKFFKDGEQREEELQRSLHIIKDLNNLQSQNELLMSHLVDQRAQLQTLLEERSMLAELLERKESVLESKAAAPADWEQLAQELEALKSERDSLKGDIETLKEADQEQKDYQIKELTALLNEREAILLSCTKLRSELELGQNMLKHREAHIANLSCDLDHAQHQNKALVDQIVEYGRQVARLNQELAAKGQELVERESKLSQLSSSLEVSRGCIGRLEAELESVRHQSQQGEALLLQLEAIQEGLARTEKSAVDNVNHYTETLKKEKLLLESECAKLKQEIQSLYRDQEILVTNLRSSLEAEKKARFDLEKEAGVLHNSELSLQKTVEDLQLRLEESEKRLSILLEVQCEDDRIKLLESQLTDLRSDLTTRQETIATLEEQLALANEKSQNYKILSENLERNIENFNITREEYKKALEKEKRELECRVEEHAKEIAALKAQQIKHVQHLSDVQAELDAATEKLEKQRVEYEKRSAALSEDLNAAKTLQLSLQREASEQRTIAGSAEEKYSRIFVEHAALMQEYSLLKERHQNLESSLESVSKTAELHLKLKEDAENLLSQREKFLEVEIKRHCDRISELEQQNSLLHSQFASLSRKLFRLSATKGVPSEPLACAGEQLSDDVAELREILQFVRLEHQSMVLKEERARQDAAKYKEMYEHTAQARDELQFLLEQHRQTNQNKNSPVNQGVSAKVSAVALLKDSNILLREENTRLHTALNESKAKLKELQRVLDNSASEHEKIKTAKETLEAEKVALRNDIVRLQKRLQDYFERYKHIDPEAFAKEQLAKEKALVELNALQGKYTDMKEKIKNMEVQYKEGERKHELVLEELKNGFEKEKEELSKKHAELVKKIENLTKHVLYWKNEARKLDCQLNTAKVSKEALEKTVQTLEQRVGEMSASKDTVESFRSAVQELEKEKKNLEKELNENISQHRALLAEKERKIQLLTKRLLLQKSKETNANTAVVTQTSAPVSQVGVSPPCDDPLPSRQPSVSSPHATSIDHSAQPTSSTPVFPTSPGLPTSSATSSLLTGLQARRTGSIEDLRAQLLAATPKTKKVATAEESDNQHSEKPGTQDKQPTAPLIPEDEGHVEDKGAHTPVLSDTAQPPDELKCTKRVAQATSEHIKKPRADESAAVASKEVEGTPCVPATALAACETSEEVKRKSPLSTTTEKPPVRISFQFESSSAVRPSAPTVFSNNQPRGDSPAIQAVDAKSFNGERPVRPSPPPASGVYLSHQRQTFSTGGRGSRPPPRHFPFRGQNRPMFLQRQRLQPQEHYQQLQQQANQRQESSRGRGGARERGSSGGKARGRN